MIILKLKGGMGNQMFQYAIGRALSVKYGVPLGIDLSYLLDRTPRPKYHKFSFRNYDLEYFNINARVVSQSAIPFIHRRHFKGILGVYIDGAKSIFDKIFNKGKYYFFDKNILEKGENAYLDGYYQNPKYFASIKDLLRKELTLKNPPTQKIQDLTREIREGQSLCINVRRGDYVGDSQYEITGIKYFLGSFEKMKSLTPIGKIYVFSDDIEWCKNNLTFPCPTMFVGKEYSGAGFEAYLSLMSACHNFIIPNSTFAWWAAWLCPYNDKIVIAPKEWLKSFILGGDDIVPKEWIRL